MAENTSGGYYITTIDRVGWHAPEWTKREWVGCQMTKYKNNLQMDMQIISPLIFVESVRCIWSLLSTLNASLTAALIENVGEESKLKTAWNSWQPCSSPR
jgi:hypothetical protein